MKTAKSLKSLRIRKAALGLLAACGVLAGAVFSRGDSYQLLSARNPAVPLPAGGDGNSVSPILTPDGRFVLFTSFANDLVPGGNSQFSLNLYLRDRSNNTTVLVSPNLNGTGGGNGSSFNGMVSTNGRWVVFQSDASDLVSGDTNGATDVFVRDVQTGSTVLVSVATNGGWANGVSTDPAITPDGRYVAFVSAASNLVPNDTNGITDVFVRDLVNQTTVLASVGSGSFGLQTGTTVPTGAPAITPDGTRVAFFSTIKNFVASTPSSSAGEVYMRDLVANQTTWVSSNALAVAGITPGTDTFISYHPKFSADGRFVVFKVSPSSQKTGAVLEYDSNSKSLVLAATNWLPLMFGDDVYGPEISGDGRFVAYTVENSLPISQLPNSSIYLADTQTGSNVLVSVCQDGSTNGGTADTAVISPDGRFVAFVSNATNLVANVISNGFHIYLRDLVAGSTTLVDADTNGVGVADEYGNAPSLSAGGGLVAFSSPDGNFVGNDVNHAQDVFVRNMTNNVDEMVSVRDATVLPATGNGISSAAQVSIAPNGRWAVFSSSASDLVTNDFNQERDIFVTDVTSGTTTLESVGLDGNAAVGGYSYSPLISSNGQFVVFCSTATNLVPGYTNVLGDIFLRDRVAGTNTLVSVSTDGVTPGQGSSTSPAMSQDGRYVAFLSTATNLVSAGTPGLRNTFLRDMAAGVTVALTSDNFTAAHFAPSISADGRYVAYSVPTSGAVAVWDSQNMANIYVSKVSASSAFISSDGSRLIYQSSPPLPPYPFVVFDLASKTNVFSTTNLVLMSSPAQLSADGRFFTIVVRTNYTVVTNAFNGQVYLGDVAAGTLALVSSTTDHTTVANSRSDSPALSGNGRDVVYRSSATDIASGTLPRSSLIVFDRATGSNTVINAAPTNMDWSLWVSRPVMDVAGQAVVFQSMQSALGVRDLNRAPDMYLTHPAVTQDSDGDGIPDWWMIKYFGHPTALASDLSRAQDDADGDGMTNLAEFLTGSNPLDPQSCLRLDISPAIDGSPTVTLNWPAVAGKSYQVQYKTDLNDPAWQNWGSPVVANPSVSVVVPLTTPTAFYRVVAIN